VSTRCRVTRYAPCGACSASKGCPRTSLEIVKVYKDHGISGTRGRDKRPAFDKLCRDAALREFDVVMAWSVDRLGRSLQDLVGFLSDREYLTTAEIERLMAAARKSSRHGHRDATMILIGYRHGLRASELCDLQWSQVELATSRLHVRRAKNGSPSVHPMQGDEIRALRRLQCEQGLSSHVFMTERDGPMTPKAFHALFGRIGERAKMPLPVHPHMLRHGCGYALANAGHDTRALQAWSYAPSGCLSPRQYDRSDHGQSRTRVARDRGSDGLRDRQSLQGSRHQRHQGTRQAAGVRQAVP
jgi:Phage integrase family/Resolvase, N terminal domain